MLNIKFALTISFLTVFCSCASNEIGDSKDVAQDKIYQHYSVDCREGHSTMDLKARFRFAGRNGTTLVLNNPSSVSFDNSELKVDSSDGSGAFYKAANPPAARFAEHSFTFTDINNKKYVNEFSMSEFRVDAPGGAVPRSGSLRLPYSLQPSYQLGQEDYIRLATTNSDSSFSVTVDSKDKPGYITIPAEYLKKQKGKQLELEATLYRKLPLKEATAEGGEIEIEYVLKPLRISLAQ